MLEHRGCSQANPYTTLLMKVRAYLAKEEDRMVPKKDSGRHIDFESSTDDPEEVQQIIDILFPYRMQLLDRFSSSPELEQHLNKEEIIHHKFLWTGPGLYILWMPERHRFVYQSKVVLDREIGFAIDLEENIERNSSGDEDYLFKEL